MWNSPWMKTAVVQHNFQVFFVKCYSIWTLFCLLCMSTLLLYNLLLERKGKERSALVPEALKNNVNTKVAAAASSNFERQWGRGVKRLPVTRFLSIRRRLKGLSSCSLGKNRGRFCQTEELTSREDGTDWALWRGWRDGRVNFDLLGESGRDLVPSGRMCHMMLEWL